MSNEDKTQSFDQPLVDDRKWYEKITRDQLIKGIITGIAGVSIFELGVIIGQNHPTLKRISIENNPYLQGGVL